MYEESRAAWAYLPTLVSDTGMETGIVKETRVNE